MVELIALVSALFLSAHLANPAPKSQDVDTFMAEVLENRDINWNLFYNYTFREREVLEFEGSLQVAPLQGYRREHLWFVRDGYLVRSPVSVNGVEVSEEERHREEQKWLRSLEERKKRSSGVDRETFFGLKFQPGNYYYRGREKLDDREVVVVEYYPEFEFSDKDDDEEEDEEDVLEAKMSKVFLITLLIDPEERQIVRMTLDNVGFDFLPGRWLIQIGDIEVAMDMHQPFGDVWLTRDIQAYGQISTAYGDLTVRYTKEFYDYVLAETAATYRFPPRSSDEKSK